MRRAFISFLTITTVCVGVAAVTPTHHHDRPDIVTVASVAAAPPGSVSHPFQFTLRETFAPLGSWLDGARHAHDVGVMEEAAIYKAQHAPTPVQLVSSFSAPSSTVYATGSINGVPCGGEYPSCFVLNRESHGTMAYNPQGCDSSGRTNSHAIGPYQICYPLNAAYFPAGCNPYDMQCSLAATRAMVAADGLGPWGG